MTQIYVTMSRLDYFERGRDLYKGKLRYNINETVVSGDLKMAIHSRLTISGCW